MRKIVKGTEPTSLADHRRTAPTDYNGYREKQTLREYLVVEQRGICCYCMGRIHPKELTMKIEHFLSHSGHPDMRLVYTNLFGACLGNMKGGAETHCDTFKGSKKFSYHLCTSGSIHNEIKYKSDGEICSDNQQLDTELNTILNLNFPVLKKARKSTLDGFIKANLSGKLGPLNKTKLKKFRDKWAGVSNTNPLEPYCMIVVYYLDKKIK
ncbi:hypothetical protein [Chryseobacterium sp.]|uniref:hypothetical protein n=1 Tax=Chryseobacterium sp. TaxID=1871047 RepID=UPI0028A25E78|nr:hypothetical protein [Chryseobacterium sp.]